MLDFSPQQLFFTGPLSAKYHVSLDQKAQDAGPDADPHPLEDSRGVTGTQRGKDGGHGLGLQGLEPAQREPWLRGRPWTLHGTRIELTIRLEEREP